MKKISRRTFLKAGGAGVGVAAMGAGLGSLAVAQELAPGGRSVSRTTGSQRRSIATTCLQCSARCGILAFTEDDQVVKIEGNPNDPNNQGRLCAKGHAGLNHLYNPDRLLYPMRRVGARGANVWQRISWEQALQDVSASLAEVRHGKNSNGLVFMSGLFEGAQPIVQRFLRAFGTSRFCQESQLYQSNKTVAQQITWGVSQELNDVSRSRYVLNFGSDPFESHPLYVPFVRRLMEGRMKGARLVTLDPRLSSTASKSDEWLPIRPGSDGVVALAMANVIMQRGLQDQNFLTAWTNVDPSQLTQHLSTYTPDMASEVSGLSASDIERIAVEFVNNKPSTTISAGGATLNAHGVQTERAIALLNIVAGVLDVPGGYCLPRTFDLLDADPIPPDPGQALSPVQASRLFAEIREAKLPVQALVTNMANPVYSYPDPDLTVSVLGDLDLVPFYAAVDSYVTESSIWADIILPAAIYLESWDIQSTLSLDLVPQVNLMQPVLPPQGESRPFHDICIQLAGLIGGGMEKYFEFGSMEGYVSAIAARIPGLSEAGGLKYLKQNGCWRDPQARPTYRSYEAKGFSTPSGKVEIASKAMQAAGASALPEFSPTQARDGGDQLSLVTFQWNVHTYGRTASCMWLSEIAHDNPVWIHPERANALGIRKGDTVSITSEKGSITAKAWLTQGIHPDVIAMGGSVGHWESGRVAQGKSFQSKDPNTQHIWWEKSGNGVDPSRLNPLEVDPVGGGPAWMGLPVTLAKVKGEGA
ncbi:MAG: molybdopterin-dependent oxidoreductase [Dehalococcoidia bacterium]|nr:molybdopterin-dependent oxidoreductase [Dehalococcoidia bacterium]